MYKSQSLAMTVDVIGFSFKYITAQSNPVCIYCTSIQKKFNTYCSVSLICFITKYVNNDLIYAHDYVCIKTPRKQTCYIIL